MREHELMAVSRSFTLIDVYCKKGQVVEAMKLLNEMEVNDYKPDVYTYNALINGYSKQLPSSSSIIMELFRKMRTQNTLPNTHTFCGVFTAAAHNLSYISTGKQAHGLAIKTSSFCDVYVGSSLLNLYCKAGFLDDGCKVFDEMSERNSVSWATLISGFAMQRLVNKVLEFFNLMRRKKEEMNEFVMTSVVSAFAVPDMIDRGRMIHGLVVKMGLLRFVSVLNSLVTMYAKCGSLDDSSELFELSSNKNSITWSAMITGFAQRGDSDKALKLFSKMHFAGISCSEFTLVGVLNACSDIGAAEEGKQVHGYSLKLGFKTQMYILTALVDMYSKCGLLVDARTGFSYLQKPDIVLWTSMIAGCVQNGENEEALSLYGRMQRERILPNELTMASVLKACSSLVALDQGTQVHACTIKYGLGLEVPIGSALSTMYAKCGSMEEGTKVFRRIPERDVLSWNAMISGFSQNGHGKEALDLFEEMLVEGTRPDYVTFVNVLSACSHMGLVHRAWTYFHMMSDKFSIVPGLEHYSCMVDVLGRAGKLDEAKAFIESAKVDHGMCLWRILLSACRNYRNYELGAYAGEKLMELGSQESSAYVLLSSIYSALGKPNDVERVRRLMKVRGVSKDPGCSWIEIKGCIHVFVVGDQIHPQIENIRTEIRRLSKQMKDKDYRRNFISSSILSKIL